MLTSRILSAVFLAVAGCCLVNANTSILSFLTLKMTRLDPFLAVEKLGGTELASEHNIYASRMDGKFWHIGNSDGGPRYAYLGSFPQEGDPLFTEESLRHLRPGELITAWKHIPGTDSLSPMGFFLLKDATLINQPASSTDPVSERIMRAVNEFHPIGVTSDEARHI